jgi:hypothetical protein
MSAVAGDNASTSRLVRFTDSQYGPAPDGATAPTTRYYDDRLAWMVTFPDVTVRGNGRYGQSTPLEYTASLVVFIDAQTGEFLEAATA